MMLILHIFADGNLCLKLKESDTGVSQIPWKCGKKVVREGPRRWHAGTPVCFCIFMEV